MICIHCIYYITSLVLTICCPLPLADDQNPGSGRCWSVARCMGTFVAADIWYSEIHVDSIGHPYFPFKQDKRGIEDGYNTFSGKPTHIRVRIILLCSYRLCHQHPNLNGFPRMIRMITFLLPFWTAQFGGSRNNIHKTNQTLAVVIKSRVTMVSLPRNSSWYHGPRYGTNSSSWHWPWVRLARKGAQLTNVATCDKRRTCQKRQKSAFVGTSGTLSLIQPSK